MQFISFLLAVLFSLIAVVAGPVETYAAKIVPLVDPAKLATLKERGANPRVQKVVYWLAIGRSEKTDPGKVVDVALGSVGVRGKAAELTKQAKLDFSADARWKAPFFKDGQPWLDREQVMKIKSLLRRQFKT